MNVFGVPVRGRLVHANQPNLFISWLAEQGFGKERNALTVNTINQSNRRRPQSPFVSRSSRDVQRQGRQPRVILLSVGIPPFHVFRAVLHRDAFPSRDPAAVGVLAKDSHQSPGFHMNA